MAQVRELVEVVNSNNAQVGVFLTLEEPTKPMREHAASAGHYTHEDFAPVPKIQIVTIDEAMRLLDRSVRIPARRGDAFKKAPKEAAKPTSGDLFS